MKKQDLISVVVPIFQVKDYLNKCVDSILAQSYQKIEVVLVDDGSTDGCSEICDLYAQKDSRVKVVHKINGGLSSARNEGIKKSEGKYIAFIDSDDWVAKDFLQVLYDICEENACEIGQCGFVNASGLEKDKECHSIRSAFVFDSVDFLYSQFSLFSWECELTWNKLYLRSLFDSVEFPEGKLHEDVSTTYKLIHNASRVALVSTQLYYYRRRNNSIMGTDYNYKRLDQNESYLERETYHLQRGENELARLTKEEHLKWIRRQQKYFKKISKRDQNIEKRMDNLRIKLEEELLTNEATNLNRRKCSYLFPFDCVLHDSRIILYGAGNVGRQFFVQNYFLDYCDVVLWVDKNYKKLRYEGIPALSPEMINEYVDIIDSVVISVLNADLAKEIMCELIEKYGIEENKIIYSIRRYLG